ncbi:MAG: M20 family metallopeptidase [Acidobacteriota bacterium]|jgi:amidohydrolase
MDAGQLKRLALEEAERLAPEAIALSRALFDHPELSGEEVDSVERIRGVLEGHGFQVEVGLAGLPTAFRATASAAARPGPRVAFLAEYDALPEIGHGCGHNLIGAAGVFAGIVAARVASRSRGSVAVIGTPAEETIGGKVVLARAGVFDDYDAAMLVHPSAEDRAHSTSLACSGMEVEFLGKSAHAVAHPEKGINALDAVLQLFMAVDAARRRWSPQVKAPGVILEGGKRANIIPERAVAQFSVRAPTIREVRDVRQQIERMIQGIATATGTRFEIRDTDNPYFEMVSNDVLARAYADNLRALGREPVEGPRRNQGSLDMGNVSFRCPAIHPFVAICPPELASHTRDFGLASVSERGERALVDSVKAMAMTAADLFAWRHLAQEARAAFQAFRTSLEGALG